MFASIIDVASIKILTTIDAPYETTASVFKIAHSIGFTLAEK